MSTKKRFKMKSFYGVAGLALLALGCATGQMAVQHVREQAAFDLQCSQEQIDVQKIADEHSFMGSHIANYGARGCGKQLSYKASCGLGSCTVMSTAAASSLAGGK